MAKPKAQNRKPCVAINARPEIREVRLTDYVPHPENPREIAADADAGLNASLRAFGYVDLIIVNQRTHRILSGHQRHRHLLEAGVTTAPCIIVDLDDARERELLISMNNPQICGTFTADLLPLIEKLRAEIPQDAVALRLEALREEIAKQQPVGPKAGLTDPDAVPEPPAKAITKPGDLWLLGEHRVLCGDSTKAEHVERLNAGQLPACAIFDPEWDSVPAVNLPPDKLVFTDGLRCGEAITMHGVPRWIFVWDGVTSWYVAKQPLWRAKFALWYGSAAFDLDGSHYGTPGDDATVTNPRGSYRYKSDPRGKHLADIFQRPLTQEHHDGPSHSKPVDWVRLLVADCMPNGVIFDPFIGSGTTLIAAEQLGRRCYGMEIAPRYVDVIVKRWEEFTGRKAVLENAGKRGRRKSDG